MHVKVGDKVIVIAGKDKGKTGKVLKFKRIGLFTINVLRVVKTMDNACRGYRKDTFL